MEENEIDPFSLLTIQSNSSPFINESPLLVSDQDLYESINETLKLKCQKLKPQRKGKESDNTSSRLMQHECLMEQPITSDAFMIRSSLNSSPCSYKLRIKYDGFFKSIKNGTQQKYCFGKMKTFHVDPISYTFGELLDELSRMRHLENQVLSLCFLDKRTKLFSALEDENSFTMMLAMYKEENEVMIYVTVLDEGISSDSTKMNMNLGGGSTLQTEENGEYDNFDYEEGSDYCHSESSYHSIHSSDKEYLSSDEDGMTDLELEGEVYSYDKDNPVMEVGAQYPGVRAFRTTLSHYALITDFEYFVVKSDPTRVTTRCAKRGCNWRVHASVVDDGVTFVVKTLKPKHSYSGINKSGNKHATKAWVADRVVNDLRSEGDIPTIVLKKKLERKYGIQIPYLRVWHGKELAIEEIYGKWNDSFIQIGAFKEEILKRNPGSVVEFETEPVKIKNRKRKCIETIDGSRHFQRFFIALGACTSGFLGGCRPYIGIDACHLKGKWNGFLVAATSLDGNNWMFLVAFGVIEIESEESWEWFLKALHKAIGMPEGLVIASDMQKGLVNAVSKVFPMAEHRECMRHLYKNFKMRFSGKPIKTILWAAARTCSPNRFEKLMAEMKKQWPTAIDYLNKEHSILWSKSKFGTATKCDNITNNISETFNSWISEERHKPVLDCLDSIRKKIMVRFHERRQIARRWKGSLVPKINQDINNISRNLGDYEVNRCTDSCAEVENDGKRWEINLTEKTCTCREWQLNGIPCVHAAACIASIPNAKWEKYVDRYFTIDRFKASYAGEIGTMPSRDEWTECNLGYKMLPPIIKRPPGRPRKRRIKGLDEKKKKKSNKCSRCGMPGHHRNTCKDDVPFQFDEENQDLHTVQGSTSRFEKKRKTRAKKTVCTESLMRVLQEEHN